MKVKFFLGVLILITSNSCYYRYTYPIYQVAKDISKDFSFTVEKVDEGRTTRSVRAKKGFKLIMLDFKFNNRSAEKIEFDTEEIYLVDVMNKVKYRNVSIKRMSGLDVKGPIKVDPNKPKTISITFAVPRGFKPENILVKDQLVPLNLKEDKDHQPL